MTPDRTSEKKTGRIPGTFDLARQLWHRPSSVFPLLRKWSLRLWVAKGGGFYGLGYVVTFVVLETRTLAGDFSGSETMAGFVTSQAVQHIIRISIESFLNAVFALLWPIYLLQWLGLLAPLVLVAGYFVFERVGRPSVEVWLPELREAREAREARAAARKAAKAEKGRQTL